jgi:hypothetical protein
MTHAVLFGAGIALASLLIAIVRNWQAGAPDPVGRVGPPKLLMALPIIVGTAFAARASWGLLTDKDVQWLIILAPGAAAIVLFLPALFRSDVFVSEGQISGPASLVGPFTWYGRNTIPVSDITTVGNARFGYTFAEGADGRRVYIGNSYRGASGLIASLEAGRTATSVER